MAVMVQCDMCHNLNATGRQVCWKCDTKLPLHGKGLVKFIEWRRDGKKHRKSLGRIGLIEAQRIAAEVKHANKQKRHTVITVCGPGTIGWKEGLERFIAQKRIEGVSEGRIRTVRDIGGKMLSAWGNIQIDSITHQMVSDFLESHRERLKPSTLNLYYKVGRAIFRFNAPDAKCPFSGISFRLRERRISPLSREQELALLDKAKGDLREILIVALATGMRRSNVLGLEWGQIDIDAKIIRVVQKGGRNHVLPMAASVLDILSQKERTSPYVWPSPITGKPYTTLSRQWRKAKRDAGIPACFRFHDLRHTVGTRIVEAHGNTRYAQEVLGHSSPTMTNRYAHIISDRLREIVEDISPKVTKPTK